MVFGEDQFLLVEAFGLRTTAHPDVAISIVTFIVSTVSALMSIEGNENLRTSFPSQVVSPVTLPAGRRVCKMCIRRSCQGRQVARADPSWRPFAGPLSPRQPAPGAFDSEYALRLAGQRGLPR